ncbi:YbaN family protein [Devosia sp. A449]
MTGLRAVYLVLGWIMLALGAAGAVLPLLPTTPFVLAALWFFYRSSPRMAAWLLAHPVLGTPLRNWQREGAIATRTKAIALGTMALGYGAALYFYGLGLMIAVPLAVTLLAVASFIATRPAPSR